MMKKFCIWAAPVFLAFPITHAHAENSDWVVVATVNSSNLEVKKSSITKIQNNLVFDSYTTMNVGAGIRSLDRYIVSCDGKLAAQISGVPVQSTESKDRTRWLDNKDTTILASTNSLVIDADFANEYWFMTQPFKAKIQAWCKGTPKGLKNVDMSIASSNKNDQTVETHVLLLDSMRSLPKYREVWIATYDVSKKPITYTDSATGEKTHLIWNDKPQYERSPIGTANSRIRYRFRCSEKKIASAQSVTYSKSGDVVRSQTLTDAEINLNWTEVIPRSIGEGLLEFVCAL